MSSLTDSEDEEGPRAGTMGTTSVGVKGAPMRDVQSGQTEMFMAPTLEDSLNFAREVHVLPLNPVDSAHEESSRIYDIRIAGQNSLYPGKVSSC